MGDLDYLTDNLEKFLNKQLDKLWNGNMDAKEWMEFHDIIFKLCVKERDNEIFKIAVQFIYDKRKDTAADVYIGKVKILSRPLAYLHRFWVPLQKNMANSVTLKDGTEIEIDAIVKVGEYIIKN